MNPRRAWLVGALFVLIAVFYAAFQVALGVPSVDLAGVTMLIALGGAMSIMAYVLLAGAHRG